MQRRAARRRRIGRLAVPSSERSCEERKLLWRDRRGHVINNQRRHTQKQAQQKQRESGEAQLRPTEQYKQHSSSDNKRQAQQMAPDIKPGYASPQPIEQQTERGRCPPPAPIPLFLSRACSGEREVSANQAVKSRRKLVNVKYSGVPPAAISCRSKTSGEPSARTIRTIKASDFE